MGPEWARASTNPNYYHLSNLTHKDNIEAYLYAFDTMATTARWSLAQWNTILGPY